MAKRPTKKKPDPLKVALKQLAVADRESARAIRFLCEALMEPVRKAVFKDCEFKYEKKKYKAKLTASQCQTVMTAVDQNENVLQTVSNLLGGLSCQVGDSANALMEELGITEKLTSSKPIQLGCCEYEGGHTPNLSQAQCNQYSPTNWDPLNPNCTPEKPRN
jgi:hypothetical protein